MTIDYISQLTPLHLPFLRLPFNSGQELGSLSGAFDNLPLFMQYVPSEVVQEQLFHLVGPFTVLFHFQVVLQLLIPLQAVFQVVLAVPEEVRSL